MAIEKLIETASGVEVKYWSIAGMPSIDKVNKKASIILHGYLSKEKKQAGKEPELVFQYNIDNETIEPVTTKRDMTLKERRELPSYIKIDEEFLEQWRKNPDFAKLTKEEIDAREFNMIEFHKQHYVEITDKELMKLDLTLVTVDLGNKVPYFDQFLKILEKDGWQTAAYEFIKNHTEISKAFVDSKDI